jgi:membrane-associated PAP2 superfamily phosphatase
VTTASRPPQDLLVTLAGLVLLLWWEASGWDLALSRAYGSLQGFALRDHWLLRGVIHDGGRLLAGAALAATLAWAALGDAAAMARRMRWAWAGTVVLGLLSVPALKRLSSTSCPWDLDEFGGLASYVPHWLLMRADGGPGQCFPSGHAVAAFAFLPLYFQWRRARPQRACLVLLAIVVFGTLFGWAQLVRGAHFASHTLWTAWLCWVIGAATARVLDSDAQPTLVPAARARA